MGTDHIFYRWWCPSGPVFLRWPRRVMGPANEFPVPPSPQTSATDLSSGIELSEQFISHTAQPHHVEEPERFNEPPAVPFGKD